MCGGPGGILYLSLTDHQYTYERHAKYRRDEGATDKWLFVWAEVVNLEGWRG